MCGVFFSVGFYNLPASVIDSVTHRGPDGRGWKEFMSPYGPVVMAHRRLSIVDLSANGHQPMASDDKRFWITYNGEIYNYLEIRKELERVGYNFKTKTDTEVLLKSYIHWGEDCLNQLNGMFAFVIWDDKEKKAFAARDRFGVKPLYYYRQGDKIAFASEIKQFVYLQGFIPKLEQETVLFYFLGSYTNYSEKTFFQNVYCVNAGHYVSVSERNFEKRIWYNIAAKAQKNFDSKTQKTSRIHDLLYDSVRLRLRSDVKVGSCLSGGIDSSSIVGIVSHILSQKTNFDTFSACYPFDEVDESHYINHVLSKTRFNSFKVTPDPKNLIKELETLVYHHDQPVGGGTVYAQWCVFQKAKEMGSIVMLDGQGSDEIFSGYHSMMPSIHNEFLIKGSFIRFLTEMYYAKNIGCSLKTSIIRIMEDCYPKIASSIAQWKKYNSIPSWVNKDFAALFVTDSYSPILQNLVSYHENFSIKDSKDMSLLKLKYTLPSLLHFEDRNSMAHSIESRTPFLDYRLVEYALSLSASDKIEGGITKKVLRDAMKEYLPREVFNRKDKIGFAVPETKWMAIDEVKKYARDIIAYTADTIPEFVNREQVIQLKNLENTSGQYYKLWCLFDLGVFLSKFSMVT